jgi:hypothetical protein
MVLGQCGGTLATDRIRVSGILTAKAADGCGIVFFRNPPAYSAFAAWRGPGEMTAYLGATPLTRTSRCASSVAPQ